MMLDRLAAYLISGALFLSLTGALQLTEGIAFVFGCAAVVALMWPRQERL